MYYCKVPGTDTPPVQPDVLSNSMNIFLDSIWPQLWGSLRATFSNRNGNNKRVNYEALVNKDINIFYTLPYSIYQQTRANSSQLLYRHLVYSDCHSYNNPNCVLENQLKKETIY